MPHFSELGTSIVPLAGRHPLALGAQAHGAKRARWPIHLGVGTSHQVVVEGFFGESYSGVFARTEQFVDALVALLDGQPCNVEGTHMFAKGWLTIEAEPVPLLLAALGLRMLDLAGRMTAGTSVANCGPKTIANHIAPHFNDAAERAGRRVPRIVAMVAVCVTDDVEGVRSYGREQTRMYDTFPSYRRALDREGLESGADLTLAGSIEQIVEGFDRYAEAGATDLRLMLAARTDDERRATREGSARDNPKQDAGHREW